MSFIRFSTFALFVLTVAFLNSVQGKKCVGCFQEIKTDDKYLKITLPAALSTTNADNMKILKIISAQRQVVAGSKYKVKFLAEIPGVGEQVCNIEYFQSLSKIGGNRNFRVSTLNCSKE